jgi:hypothetical protein
VSHLILLKTASVSHDDLLALRRHSAETAAADREVLSAIAATARYQSGELGTDVEYYRIHFRRGLPRPEHLERVVPRLRIGMTPEGIRKSRAIEERLYEQTWPRDDYDLLPRLSRLRVPTLLLHGDLDLVPVECAEHIARAIPGARLVVLKECGHFAYLERPDEVREALTALLGDPCARPRRGAAIATREQPAHALCHARGAVTGRTTPRSRRHTNIRSNPGGSMEGDLSPLGAPATRRGSSASLATSLLAAALLAAGCAPSPTPRPPSLAGAWRSSIQFETGAFASIKDLEFMYVFHEGGTMTESSNYDAAPPVPPAYGVWRTVGTNEFEATYEFFATAPSAPKDFQKGAGWLPSGRGRLTEKIHLSADGQSFTSEIQYEALGMRGEPVEGSGNAAGRGARIRF